MALSLTSLSSLTETESENEFRPLDGRIDEFHPKATRTLFIGNLEKTTNYQQLLDVFQRFGEIVVSGYAKLDLYFHPDFSLAMASFHIFYILACALIFITFFAVLFCCCF